MLCGSGVTHHVEAFSTVKCYLSANVAPLKYSGDLSERPTHVILGREDVNELLPCDVIATDMGLPGKDKEG